MERLNKKLLEEKFEEYGVDSVKELAEYIIENFKDLFEMTINDIFTQMFFRKLINNENTEIFSAYESDVESLIVFVYQKDDYYTYYIPDEIKKIIKKKIK